ncbi:hypothetical protein MTO96_020325 [Rhipicephalus appendiculatus]
MRCLRTVPCQARASSDASCPVVCDKQGRILLVGLNRPEKRNCLNVAAAKRLLEAFREFDQDNSVDVAVLHGKGGSFCAGYDLSELAEHIPEEWPQCIPETKKPTIAAVSGYAVGAGLELALWCDLRVVDETAVMGLFGRRFGVPLIAGGFGTTPHPDWLVTCSGPGPDWATDLGKGSPRDWPCKPHCVLWNCPGSGSQPGRQHRQIPTGLCAS